MKEREEGEGDEDEDPILCLNGFLTDARDQPDQDLEENQSEMNQKYRELKKREERMDQFLQSFDDTKEEEQQKLTELEGQIPSLLEGIYWNLVSVGHLPTSQVTEQNNFAISEFHQQQESGIQLRSRIRSTVIEIDLNSF